MKYIISLFILLFTGCLYGQSLQVSVRDNNGSLPYASVYINQNLSGITDPEGFAFLSLDKLNYGDTITSTYIGMKPASIIYNKQMHGLSKCTIILDNDKVYELDPVVIKAFDNDGWKIFHKSVKTYNSFTYMSCIVKGKFKAEVLLPQETIPHNIDGSFELENKIPQKTPLVDFYKYYFTTLHELTTSSQDTAVKNRTISAIKQSISTSCQTISRINWERWNNSKYSKVSYLGINNNCQFFRIVYTNKQFKDSLSFQVLFSVNKDNQEIETVEYYIPLRIYSSSFDREKILSAVCQKLVYKKGKKVDVTIPVEIGYNDKLKDNTMINLILSDLSFKIVN